MPEVKILSQVHLMVYPTPEKAETVVAVTYQTGFLPPRTVYIPENEVSDDKIRAAIKADLEKAEKTPPQTMEV